MKFQNIDKMPRKLTQREHTVTVQPGDEVTLSKADANRQPNREYLRRWFKEVDSAPALPPEDADE